MLRKNLTRDDGAARLTIKPKVCACGCGREFLPVRPMQVVARMTCARRVVDQKKKAEREREKERKDAAKPRGYWMAQAQAAFNAWVRLRDELAGLPCVSCGRMHNGQWHAGHFLSVGARPELRFCESQVWRQCAPCNSHLHGNLVLYRAELIRRVGQAEVDRLEGPHAPKKYTVAELQAIRDEYRARTRALKKERQ